MTCAVKNVGEATAGASLVVELCTVLERIDGKPAAVDLRGPQRGVPFRTFSFCVVSLDVLKHGARIRDGGKPYIRGNRCSSDQEGANPCNHTNSHRAPGPLLSR